MFNPFSLFKKQPDAMDPKMIRDFLKQMSKLSPTERAYIKQMMGSHLKQKISPADMERAFKEMDPKFQSEFTPEELNKLKEEIIDLLS